MIIRLTLPVTTHTLTVECQCGPVGQGDEGIRGPHGLHQGVQDEVKGKGLRWMAVGRGVASVDKGVAFCSRWKY